MNTTIIQKNEQKTEYFCSNDTGDARISVYHLYPGIDVSYLSLHMDSFDFTEVEQREGKRCVGFYYCKEGRIEQSQGNEFFYLMPGDCSVVIQDKEVKQFSFPLKHFHGLNIFIDLEQAPNKFAEFIEKEAFSPLEVAQKLCRDKTSVILRSVLPLKHIFTESYAVAEAFRADYLKIKLLELLCVLNQCSDDLSIQTDLSVPRTQAELVKQAAEYISTHINEKVTLKSLTREFGVSESYLQSSFRAVYGMPVISFVRAQKMQAAAQVLIHSDRNVDDIAEEFGYINESKFSAVFKRIMGDSPSTFRKEHSKIKIL